jgi:hypothetical protein
MEVMQKIHLSKVEINDLINKYQSELRKLEFQAARTRITIQQLMEQLAESVDQEETSPINFGANRLAEVEAPAPPPPPADPKRPRKRISRSKKKAPKIEVSEVEAQKPSRKPRKRVRKKGGYRLSDWDNFILDTLQEEQKIMINADFLDKGIAWQNTQDNPMTPTEIKGKISRSIHKLANKRKAIIKVNFPGKGYAYALTNWVTKSGNLKKKYSK